MENRKDYKSYLTDRRGYKNSNVKLKPEQVLLIREDKRKLKEIAKEYGVSMTTISQIRLKKEWSHL